MGDAPSNAHRGAPSACSAWLDPAAAHRTTAGRAAFLTIAKDDESGTIPYVKVRDLRERRARTIAIVTVANASPARSPALRSPSATGTIVLPKIGGCAADNSPRRAGARPSCLDQNVMGVTSRPGTGSRLRHCLARYRPRRLSARRGPRAARSQRGTSREVSCASLASVARARSRTVRAAPSDSRLEVLTPMYALIERQIALLRERRQALITAAVTGKLQVPTQRRRTPWHDSGRCSPGGGVRGCDRGAPARQRVASGASIDLRPRARRSTPAELLAFIGATQQRRRGTQLVAPPRRRPGHARSASSAGAPRRGARPARRHRRAAPRRRRTSASSSSSRTSARRTASRPTLVAALRGATAARVTRQLALLRRRHDRRARPRAVRQRPAGRDRRAEEPAHRPDRRARQARSTARDRDPTDSALRPARCRPLRRRPRRSSS